MQVSSIKTNFIVIVLKYEKKLLLKNKDQKFFNLFNIFEVKTKS